VPMAHRLNEQVEALAAEVAGREAGGGYGRPGRTGGGGQRRRARRRRCASGPDRETLREAADAARKGRGRLARLRAAWRGE
jgi:hypothetical protein